jgi:RNA 3'-terminal phosphate cyclase (ATP)
MSIIVIDGSQGEGGGQVLRTSLALSMVTGQPFRIEQIRAGRANPGLLRQHLTCVRASADICGATVHGAELGSKHLTFEPSAIRTGDYQFSIGTAGSTTLVLQTVLPALLTAKGRSTLTLEGGTHNPAAPPFDFVERVFLPLINRMGPCVSATLKRHGFFPAGGGYIHITIDPVEQLQPLELLTRGEIRRRTCCVLLCNLPRVIAEREWQAVSSSLNWSDDCLDVPELPRGHGPGNVVMLELESDSLTELFTAFGRKQASSEHVAHEAVKQVREYLKSSAPVGEHLADQLLLPLALAGRGSFMTTSLSRHATTNIDVIRQFLDIPIETIREEGVVRVMLGSGASPA